MELDIEGDFDRVHFKQILGHTHGRLKSQLKLVPRPGATLVSSPKAVADILIGLADQPGWIECYILDYGAIPHAIGDWTDGIITVESIDQTAVAAVVTPIPSRSVGVRLATKRSHLSRTAPPILSFWWYVGAIIVSFAVVIVVSCFRRCYPIRDK